jgi:dCMP deaminase
MKKAFDSQGNLAWGIEKRLKWYFELIDVIKKRSSCGRKKVGAILINPDNHRILSMGYNGSVPGAPHCNEDNCLVHEGHCINTLHAELNALANLQGNSEGLVMILSTEPCLQCTKIMMAFKIQAVVYEEAYPNKEKKVFENNLKSNHVTPLTSHQFIGRIHDSIKK